MWRDAHRRVVGVGRSARPELGEVVVDDVPDRASSRRSSRDDRRPGRARGCEREVGRRHLVLDVDPRVGAACASILGEVVPVANQSVSPSQVGCTMRTRGPFFELVATAHQMAFLVASSTSEKKAARSASETSAMGVPRDGGRVPAYRNPTSTDTKSSVGPAPSQSSGRGEDLCVDAPGLGLLGSHERLADRPVHHLRPRQLESACEGPASRAGSGAARRCCR